MNNHKIIIPLDEYEEWKRRVAKADEILKVVPKKYKSMNRALQILLTTLHKQHDLAPFFGDVNDAQDIVRFYINKGIITMKWIDNPIEDGNDEDEDTELDYQAEIEVLERVFESDE